MGIIILPNNFQNQKPSITLSGAYILLQVCGDGIYSERARVVEKAPLAAMQTFLEFSRDSQQSSQSRAIYHLETSAAYERGKLFLARDIFLRNL